MSGLRWAAVPLVVGGLAGNVAAAAAEEPAPGPTPTPTAAADPTPTPTPVPIPTSIPTVVAGTVIYITTVTTTTTIVSAPITVIAAPITTTINSIRNSTSSSSAVSNPGGAASRDTAPARMRLVMNLTGCGRPAGRSRHAARGRRRAHVQLAGNATLVVRVNGKRVTAIRIPSSARHPRVALQLRLAASGTLTVRRPSGRVLAIQGCTPRSR